MDVARSLQYLIDFDARTGPAESNIRSLTASIGGVQEKAGGIGSALRKSFRVAAIATAAGTTAVGVFAKSAINVGMTFDKSMAQVAATMGLTMSELNSHVETVELSTGTFTGTLRDFAQEMGSKTVFSASQAADALNYMALAGYDTKKSMEMLPSVLDLAAAGNMDLARASDMITDASSALGLSFKQTNELVDKMAMASSKANASVAQLGEGVLKVGTNATSLKGGTTELLSLLGALADVGYKGAEGGTHLRNLMRDLTNSKSKNAHIAFEKLGISAYDANDNLKDFRDILPQIKKGIEGMTQKEQDSILGMMVNSYDLAAFKSLINVDPSRWQELTAAIDDSAGAAKKMAETQLDNLAGDVTLFKSALEGVQITLSDQLTPTLREFVKFGANSLSKLNDAFRAGGLPAAMEAIGPIISEGLGMIIGMLPKIIGAGTQLIGAFGKALLENLPNVFKAGAEILTTIVSGIENSLPNLIPAIGNVIFSIGKGFLEGIPSIVEAGGKIIIGLGQGIISAASGLMNNLPNIISGIGDSFTTTGLTFAEKGGQMVGSIMRGMIEAIPKIVENVPKILSAIGNAIATGVPKLFECGKNLIQSFISGFRSALAGAEGSLFDLSGFLDSVLTSLPTFVKAGMDMLGNIFKGFREAIPSFLSGLSEFISTAIRALAEGLPRFVRCGIETIANFVTGIFNALPDLISTVGDIIFTFVDSIIDNLPTILETGAKMLWELVVGIVKAIPDLVIGLGKVAIAITQQLGRIPILVGKLGAKLVESLWHGISSLVGWLNEQVVGFANGVFNAVLNFFGIGGEGSLSEKFINIGKSLIEGLWNGLNAAGEWIRDSIIGVFRGIYDAVCNFFGIASPSTKFMEIGRFLVEGLWEGIKNAGDWLKEQVTGFFTNVVEGVKGMLGISSPSRVFAEIGDFMALGLGEGFSDSMVGVTENMQNAIPTSFDLPSFNEPDTSVYSVNPIVNDAELPKIPDTIYGLIPKAERFDFPETQDYTIRAVIEMPDLPDSVGTSSYGVNPIARNAELPDIADVFYELIPKARDFNQPTVPNEIYDVTPNVESPKIPNVLSDVLYNVNPNIRDASIPAIQDMLYTISPDIKELSLTDAVPDVTYTVEPIIKDIDLPAVTDIVYGVNPLVGDFTPPEATKKTASSNAQPSYVQPSSTGSTNFAPAINITVNGRMDDSQINNMRTALYDTVKQLYNEFRQEDLDRMVLKNQFAF